MDCHLVFLGLYSAEPIGVVYAVGASGILQSEVFACGGDGLSLMSGTAVSSRYREYAEWVQRLAAAVGELERAAAALRLEPLAGREWFELLRRKLVPQLRDDAFLVVAVVGGTNIGKSVIFNHLAGDVVSAASPLASGTRHPVCLVPPGFRVRHDLAEIFSGFRLRDWTSSEEPLGDCPEHLLFCRASEAAPENLLILDTPDIDSDAEVNWQRADAVRHSADVLLAVLTQQKYNDAAVKRFFRQAAAEEKAVIIVFNQCQLPEDEAYWPLWLETFCSETGIAPDLVYLSPNDRSAADANRLPFYERSLSFVPAVSAESVTPARTAEGEAVCHLGEELSRLRFEEIKLRTLRGSLRHLLDSRTGLPGYLNEVRSRSGEFRSAAERLSSEHLVRIDRWPTLPGALLVAEIRRWWADHQSGWARRVHGFYNAVGNGVLWPFRFTKNKLTGERTPPWELYREREWEAILGTIDELFEKLTWMSESGAALLRPHFERLLSGRTREELIEHLRAAQQQTSFENELETVVGQEMSALETDRPELYRFYRQLNTISAAVRPMTSVVLFSLGWGPAGHAVAPLVADAAAQTVAPILVEFAGGTAAAVAGESAISTAAGSGAGFLQAKFQKLQTAFTARRAGFLARQLKEHLFGPLPEELHAAAHLPESEAFRRVAELIEPLKREMEISPSSGSNDVPL